MRPMNRRHIGMSALKCIAVSPQSNMEREGASWTSYAIGGYSVGRS